MVSKQSASFSRNNSLGKDPELGKISEKKTRPAKRAGGRGTLEPIGELLQIDDPTSSNLAECLHILQEHPQAIAESLPNGSIFQGGWAFPCSICPTLRIIM